MKDAAVSFSNKKVNLLCCFLKNIRDKNCMLYVNNLLCFIVLFYSKLQLVVSINKVFLALLPPVFDISPTKKGFSSNI